MSILVVNVMQQDLVNVLTAFLVLEYEVFEGRGLV